MDIFFNNKDRIRINGRIFFAGQEVKYNEHTGIVTRGTSYHYGDGNRSLLCYYSKEGEIPFMLTGNSRTNPGCYSAKPNELKIITHYKEGSKSMKIPRLFKWGFLTILFTSMWRLSGPLVDLLLQFIQKNLGV